MSFKLGTVILIPFPFSDLTGLKQRPALVISSEESQRETKQIICMMITSAKPVFSTDYNLISWQESGLVKPSIIKVNRVFTINMDLVKRVLGEVPTANMNDIKSMLLGITESEDHERWPPPTGGFFIRPYTLLRWSMSCMCHVTCAGGWQLPYG